MLLNPYPIGNNTANPINIRIPCKLAKAFLGGHSVIGSKSGEMILPNASTFGIPLPCGSTKVRSGQDTKSGYGCGFVMIVWFTFVAFRGVGVLS